MRNFCLIFQWLVCGLLSTAYCTPIHTQAVSGTILEEYFSETELMTEQCGIAALFIVERVFGKDTQFSDLNYLSTPDVAAEGMTLRHFSKALHLRGFEPKAVEVDGAAGLERILEAYPVAVLPSLENKHFFVIGRTAERDKVIEFDPPSRVRVVPIGEAAAQVDAGFVLVVREGSSQRSAGDRDLSYISLMGLSDDSPMLRRSHFWLLLVAFAIVLIPLSVMLDVRRRRLSCGSDCVLRD